MTASPPLFNLVFFSFIVSNLTAHTPYELSASAKTELGDSPLSFAHVVTSGTRPPPPSLKAKAVNQTAVECNWTGPRNVVRIAFSFEKKVPYGKRTGFLF